MEWVNGVVEKRHDWAQGLFTISVRAKEVNDFIPGQFLQLGKHVSKNGEPPKRVNRPYSVASPHGELLDFFIVLVEDGRLTPDLWDLKIGDSVDVSKTAAGRFTLDKCPAMPKLWLIATGTGIAPYIAMLRDEKCWADYESIALVHGVRHIKDLAYESELSQLRETHANRFSYVPVVSRDSAEHVVSGRITTVAESGELENAAGYEFDPDTCCVMLCGNPAMLDEMNAILEKKGLTNHSEKESGNIVTEKYWKGPAS